MTFRTEQVEAVNYGQRSLFEELNNRSFFTRTRRALATLLGR